MKWFIEFLRKPRYQTNDVEKVDNSFFYYGSYTEWEHMGMTWVFDDEPYWTLSILGVINPIIQRIFRGYRIMVIGAEHLDIGGYDYSKAKMIFAKPSPLGPVKLW